MKHVTELLNLVHCIESHIGIEAVSKTAKEVHNEMIIFIEKQISLVKAEVERGTLSELYFGTANASAVKMALLYLECLQNYYPDKIDYSGIIHHVKEELHKFQEIGKLPPRHCFDEVHHQLGKLKI
eukprot:11116737-Ditylum_brightwellii.AAC.1